ncbi:hypothetical protein DVH24_025855 [Malus domestica]|uniref:Uncharacterized protein n=1 Tax=Malus domestica TaxID=3750 RepID=A0A498KEY9_MALDO|nr:hypothetical protein DVH24_025855 [Malus domestica]
MPPLVKGKSVTSETPQCATSLENRWLGEPPLPPQASEPFFVSKEIVLAEFIDTQNEPFQKNPGMVGISDAMFQYDLDMIDRMTKGFLTYHIGNPTLNKQRFRKLNPVI